MAPQSRDKKDGMKPDSTELDRTYTAFGGNKLIVSSNLETALLKTKEHLDAGCHDTVLIFDDYTGKPIDFDFRGTPDEVLSRLASHPLFASTAPIAHRGGPGRPKLGVVSREVSLLPRHWEWLEQQPQGISASLRRLVDEARKHDPGQEQARIAREAASHFMWAIAGNFADFEEASRALFAKDWRRLETLMKGWPPDIQTHLSHLIARSVRFETAEAPVDDAPRIDRQHTSGARHNG